MIYTHSETETEAFGRGFASEVEPGTTIALTGGLGAGKTAFVRGLARGLGINSHISSPTFTIVNEYQGPVELFHFDMYRLNSADELYDIGWDDYLARHGICVVEWGENVPGAFPPGTIFVNIDKISDNIRNITVSIGE